MSQRIEINGQIPASLAGKRLDAAVATLLPDYSRNRLAGWIKTGQLTVDGAARRPRDTIRGGERFSLRADMPEDDSPVAEAIPLEVVYQDEALLVINKPPGLVVHPGAGNRAGTLMNALLHHAPRLANVPRAGIVHRLDKLTSGLLVIAADLAAHNALVAAMAAREIKREYQAVVQGVVTAGGRIDVPLGRHRVDRKRMAVGEHGRTAVTHFRVMEKFRAHTHVQVSLETGRTHQIRVHMQHLRHPIVGDPVYGGRPRPPKGASEELVNCLQSFPRQALHAGKLAFAHPRSGKLMEFTAAPPEDLRRLLDLLRVDAKEGTRNG